MLSSRTWASWDCADRERGCAQAALTQKVGATLLALESWFGDKEVADVAATGTQAVG